jgi:4-hydroxy-3-polyprenylbenzoate decarboxylase
MREKYWEKGKSCPVVVTFGQDPLLFLVAGQSMPYGLSELDYYGGLRGAPIDVIRGDLTGLPIPAHAEIAYRRRSAGRPKNRCRMEGPVRRVARLLRPWRCQGAGDPGQATLTIATIRSSAVRRRCRPPFVTFGVPIGAAAIWNYLEKADVPDIKGVWCSIGSSAAAGGAPFIIVSVKQRYHGHAQQAGLAALASRGRQLSWPLRHRRR